MRDDVLAKRMFIAGCFGLPFLWTVHSLYWYRKQHPNHASDEDHQDALLANNSSSDADGTRVQCTKWLIHMYNVTVSIICSHTTVLLAFAENGLDSRSPEEIKAEAQKWVKRSFYSSIGVFAAWALWITMFHIFADRFPPSWFVRSEDEADYTGW
jgi:hypothetical protein